MHVLGLRLAKVDPQLALTHVNGAKIKTGKHAELGTLILIALLALRSTGKQRKLDSTGSRKLKITNAECRARNRVDHSVNSSGFGSAFASASDIHLCTIHTEFREHRL